MNSKEKLIVKKRETFYIGGYDPRGARHYYNLYKKEAVLQSDVNGMNLSISSRKRTKKYMQTWQINSSTDKNHTETNYNFLEWDDIIRTNWGKGFLSLFFNIIYYFKVYIFSGRFIKYIRVSPRQMYGIFFPIIYVLLVIFFSLMLSITIVNILHIDFLILSRSLIVLITLLFIFLLVQLGDKLSFFWMLRIFVFTSQYVFENQEVLEKRLKLFSSYILNVIENAKENDIDEILIVSHSVGTILFIPLLEQILKNTTCSLKNVSILTLGECIPLVSGIDKSIIFKEQMQYVSQQEEMYWLDYTSVIDLACFPYLNYFEDSNIEIKKKEKFYFLSPKFHTLYSKKYYSKVRRNIYLAHFLYLMSTEKEGQYDFFKMTAGHQYICDILDIPNQ